MMPNTPIWHDLKFWVDCTPFMEGTLLPLVRLTVPEPPVIENDNGAMLNERRYEC